MPISGAYQKGKGGSLRIFFKLSTLLGMGTLQYEILIEFGFVSTCVCVCVCVYSSQVGSTKECNPTLFLIF